MYKDKPMEAPLADEADLERIWFNGNANKEQSEAEINQWQKELEEARRADNRRKEAEAKYPPKKRFIKVTPHKMKVRKRILEEDE